MFIQLAFFAPLFYATHAAAPAPAQTPAPAPQSVAGGVVLATPGMIVPLRVAAGPSADEVVGKVQAFYAEIKQVTAKFRQEVTNAAFGDTKTSDGMVWIAKPGKMRWDYYGKRHLGRITVKKSFISNGHYLYVVEHDNKQVIRKNLEKDLMPVAISFLYGKGDLRTEFTAKLDGHSKYGGKDDLVLALTPKAKSAQYKMLYLVVDPGNYRVKQSIIIDSSNNVNHFRFYEPDFKSSVKESWFEFNEKSVPTYRIRDADEEREKMGGGAAAGSGSAAP
jgi:outer membrane lipoprotein carrier protein